MHIKKKHIHTHKTFRCSWEIMHVWWKVAMASFEKCSEFLWVFVSTLRNSISNKDWMLSSLTLAEDTDNLPVFWWAGGTSPLWHLMWSVWFKQTPQLKTHYKKNGHAYAVGWLKIGFCGKSGWKYAPILIFFFKGLDHLKSSCPLWRNEK